MDPLTIQNHLRSLEGVGNLSQPISTGVPIEADSPIAQATQTDGPSFGQMLSNYLDEVNGEVLKSDSAVSDLAAGKSADVHSALIAMQKADIQLRLLVETRNKVMSAYEEIMRMSV